jgi:IS30 family transposase
MAVPRGLIIKARRLQAAGMPDRQIAREIRISRTICQQIRRGRIGCKGASRAMSTPAQQTVPELAPRKVANYRCPVCERIVCLKPCVACAARLGRLYPAGA